jgi:hypothetical protein
MPFEPLSTQDIRNQLEERYGKDNVFDTNELTEKFEVIGFLAPYVTAVRKSDNEKVTLEFMHRPRFYFDVR